MNSAEVNSLRAELLEVAQHWQPDGKPSQAADVFFSVGTRSGIGAGSLFGHRDARRWEVFLE